MRSVSVKLIIYAFQVIEPGVEIKFMEEAGLTVRGILTADGLPDAKIKFSPYEDIQPIQPNRTLRLVDGPSINEGIVQVKENPHTN